MKMMSVDVRVEVGSVKVPPSLASSFQFMNDMPLFHVLTDDMNSQYSGTNTIG